MLTAGCANDAFTPSSYPGATRTMASRSTYQGSPGWASTAPVRTASVGHEVMGPPLPSSVDRPSPSPMSTSTTFEPVSIVDTADTGEIAATTADVQFGGGPATPASTRIGLYGEPGTGALLATNRAEGAGNLAQITFATEGACFDPDTNRDGTHLVFASTQHRRTADIYVKSTTGKTMTQLTSDPADDVMPAFAPDGREIAFASNRDGNWNIFVTNLSGTPPMQLTSDSDHELHPTWSPDGGKIAYCKLGSQSGRWEIWVIDLANRVPQFLGYGLFPQWNPDPARSKIAFQRARERGSRLFGIWTVDLVGDEAMHPTEIVSAANAAAMHPAWSPDGSRLAFVTVLDPDRQDDEHPEQSDVWVVNIDGTSRTNLTNGQFCNLYPVWAANGTVYFLSNRSGMDNIWAVATNRATIYGKPGDGSLVNVDADGAVPSALQP
jgi:TolB protein